MSAPKNAARRAKQTAAHNSGEMGVAGSELQEVTDKRDALTDEVARLRRALERIASGEAPSGHCTCGHKPEFCHKTAANRWCGGTESWAIWLARDTLNWKVVGS